MSINKFLVKKEPIEIEVDYIELDGEAIVVNDTKAISDKIKIHTMKGRFRRPSFQTFNNYIKDAVEPDGKGGSFVNFNKMRENKFRTLFVELEDADGTIYEVTKNYAILTDLHPEIASAFLDKLETVVDENRFKKMMDANIFKEEEKKEEGQSNEGTKSE